MARCASFNAPSSHSNTRGPHCLRFGTHRIHDVNETANLLRRESTVSIYEADPLKILSQKAQQSMAHGLTFAYVCIEPRCFDVLLRMATQDLAG